MKESRISLHILIISFFLIFSFFSCTNNQPDSSNQISLFDEWNNTVSYYYDSSFDKALFKTKLETFKNQVESSFSAETNAYPEIRSSNTNIINSLLANLDSLIKLCENGQTTKYTFEPLIYQISHQIAFIEHNDYLSLKKTNYMYVQFFIILIICCIVIVGLLIYFNNKEINDKQNQLTESKKYLKYVIKTQEEERSRISRELHDTIAQDMRYIGLLAGKLPDNEISAEVQKRQSDCINQIRSLCYNFAPPDIKTGNMNAALETLVSEFLSRSKIDLRLTVLDNVDFSLFDTDELLHLYRIVQEALNNIEKHSLATEATVLFRCDTIQNKKLFKLVITDDGIGIDSAILEKINDKNDYVKKSDGNHFGISGMKERAALLNGTITFDSIPDEGTEIVVCVEKKA